MAENLTPEQWAEAVIPSEVFPEAAAENMRAAIASAIRSAVEAEREACAKVADEWHEWYEKPGSGTGHAKRIAHHIRARSPSQEAANG